LMGKKISIASKKNWNNKEYKEWFLNKRKVMYTDEWRKKISVTTKLAMQRPEVKQKYIAGCLKRKISPEIRKLWIKKLSLSSKGRQLSVESRVKISNTLKKYYQNKKINHKITKIEKSGMFETYDITLEKYHNFALSCGAFVHNCGIERVGTDGIMLHRGRDLSMIGSHTLGYNDKYLGICVVGDYDKNEVPEDIYKFVLRFANELNKIFKLTEADHYYHRDFAPKSCPGNKFPSKDKFRKDMRAFDKGEF
jgi:hypothetical protein